MYKNDKRVGGQKIVLYDEIIPLITFQEFYFYRSNAK